MAAHLDGSTDSLTLASAARSGSWSFAVWVQLAVDLNDFSAFGPVFDDGGGAFYLGLGTDSDGTSPVFFDNESANLGLSTSPGGAFTGFTAGSTWYFVGGAYNSTTGAEIVVFGVGDTGSSVAIRSGTRATGKTGTAPLYIGNNSFAEVWNGAIKQVRIWTTPLTQAEFESEWSSSTAVVKTGATLWAYYPLVADANDTSGNARHLTVNGTVTFDTAEAASTRTPPMFGPGALLGPAAFRWRQTIGVTPSTGVANTQTNTGAITAIAGSIVAAVTQLKAGGVTPGPGALTKADTKTVTGAIATIVGTAAKAAAKPLTGAIASTGVLTSIKVSLKSLTATITSAGALIKAAAKTTTGTTTSSGALAKQDQKQTAGTITPTGALAKLVAKALAATIASVGTLGRSTGVITRTFTGAITTITGAITRQDQKQTVGNVTPTGTLPARAVTKTTTATITPTGNPTKAAARRFTGAVTSAGVLAAGRLFTKLLAGVIALAGAVANVKSSGLPDFNPITVTVRHRGATATVPAAGATATVRSRGASSTARENT